ncbi:MAG TPA: helix-turn-helix domain-containing protein [Candidatus Acidoferrales bacterium]|nr:helix-turn-helix domain-containing protein [Candidatus Acidoferrales bacterium]
MPALGERFRAAREARGLTLSDVAEHIRIRSVYLAAIEDENWSAIGAPVYIRGFLRTYARFLGLDPEEVVAEFNSQASAPPPPVPTAPGAPPKTTYLADEEAPARGLSPMIWIASLVAVVLIAVVVYNEATLRARQSVSVLPSNTPTATASLAPAALAAAVTASPSDGPSASPTPALTASVGPSGSPAPAGPSNLEVQVTATSWLRVTVDGNVSMEGTFPAGTVRQFHGKIARLRIGNAGGVEIIVDGKNLGTLGKTGDVVERSFTL